MTDIEELCRQYETHTLKLIAVLREAFNEQEVSNMSFSVHAYGRVATGHLKLEYKLSDTEWDGADAKGGSIYPVLVECLRRRGFDLRHKPLAIGYDGTVSTED